MLKIKILAIVMTLLSMGGGGCAQGPSKQKDNLISLSVTLTRDASPMAFEMTLTNQGMNTLRLMADNLPWQPSYIAARVNLWRARPAYQQLTEIIPLGHSARIIEVAPGDSVSGRVNLETRFPHLKEVLARGEDVMYFWGYRAILMPISDSGKIDDKSTQEDGFSNFVSGMGLIAATKEQPRVIEPVSK